ncbi:MAG: SAM-dependent methyltransferase [Bacteroidales bacterium]|nr:SAM-dependent methyltransferase [Bacteroidales bacterium]
MNNPELRKNIESKAGKLFLIPVSLGSGSVDKEIPAGNSREIIVLDEFIVENIRTARRSLRAMGYTKDFDSVKFHILDKHTRAEDIPGFLKNAVDGKNIGLLSEAGSPCIADPGQQVVKYAHSKNITVVPLVGPSSILLALIASGFNGQSFIFHGYLPIEKSQRIRKIKEIELDAIRNDRTQIFMETPFRNNALLDDLLKNSGPSTQLCIACDLTTEQEFIRTLSIEAWKKNLPDLKKRPSMFLIYK